MMGHEQLERTKIIHIEMDRELYYSYYYYYWWWFWYMVPVP